MITVRQEKEMPILYVGLNEQVSYEDFTAINDAVLEWLNKLDGKRNAVLVFNTVDTLTIPHFIEQLRMSQKYVQRRDLAWILVIGENKLIRLMMMLTFNLASAHLQFFLNPEQAHAFINRQLRMNVQPNV